MRPAHDPLPAAPVSGAAAAQHGPCPGWHREPLLHFALLGALLFALDHWLVSRRDDPRTIVLGAQADQQARQVFKASRSRDPDADELRALRERWLDNEVLYREGLALQVDRGDAAIRERVIFKALSMVDANLKLPAFDDDTLRAWFEARRARYDEPARFDFQEAVLAGANSEAAVHDFVQALNAGAPGQASAGLRLFKGRPHDNLVSSYGQAFAKALEASTTGRWQALATDSGWRAVRLDAVTPARPAVFEALRGVVLQDWTDATMAEQRTAAVRALARKYRVRLEDGAPA